MQDKNEREYEQQYAYWLYSVPGLGSRMIEQLLEQAGSPEQIYRMKEREGQTLFQNLHISLKKWERLWESRRQWDVEKEYEMLRRKGIRFLTPAHGEYPDKLRHIPDRPYGLFVKGALPKEDRLSVAVIGARNCSEYGRCVAGEFGRRLAQAGVQVISGLARGIDGISQRAAMEQGGHSYGVLGCGVDVCYPWENRDLYEWLGKEGGLISTYLPGTRPRAGYFPPRNRIISGLSHGVLVIEAGERSGTLITVDMALEQGREVFVVPGRITDRLSDGCNRLIAQGAGIILSPEHLLVQLQSCFAGTVRWESRKRETSEELPEEERAVWAILDDDPKSLEEICRETENRYGWNLQYSMHLLMTLCRKGKAGQVHGNYFIRQSYEK